MRLIHCDHGKRGVNKLRLSFGRAIFYWRTASSVSLDSTHRCEAKIDAFILDYQELIKVTHNPTQSTQKNKGNMLVLPIQNSAEDDTPQEWSLLELNGEVVPPRSHSNDNSNMELGSIRLDEKVQSTSTRF